MHLASIVTPGPDSTRELEYAVDVTGTRHVLDACVAHGVRRVVVSSSGAAYGYHPDNPALDHRGPAGARQRGVRLQPPQAAGRGDARRSVGPRWSRWCCGSAPSSGTSVDNQITALFERKRLLKIRGSESPFVFIWDTDVVAMIQQAVTGSVTGVFNVAGDGALTITEIAALLEKPVLTIPEPVLRAALAVGSRLGLRRTGRSRRCSCSTARCSPTTA